TSEVDALQGRMRMNHSIAPYVGLGWGNVVSPWRRATLLVDAGVIYGGRPGVKMTALCSAAITGTPVCDRMQEDAARESKELQRGVKHARWYPVVNIGFGIRF